MTRIANDNSDKTAPRAPDDDVIQPFQLELSGLRGRVVRLGAVLNDLLSAHEYPPAVAHLLAETVATALLLSSMLKYEGIFTLQTSSDGPVRTLVVDITTLGAIRGYASYDADVIKAMELAEERTTSGPYAGFELKQILGKGYLAFTVDQGEFTERYQGIVSLAGDALVDSVRHYFDQSEQIGTSLKVAAAHDEASGWRAGAIMLQRMPDPSIAAVPDENIAPFRPELAAEKEEEWARSNVLLQSITDLELVNPALHSHDILFRLFHEEGVRIFPPQTVYKKCRCSTDRVSRVMATLPPDDREHAATDGIIEMTCEFCSKSYHYDINDMTCSVVEPDHKKH